MAFNERMLTMAKEAAGLTQAAIAQHAGVSQSLFSKIENGLEDPSAEFLTKAAEITSVPVEFFSQSDSVLPETLFDIFHKKRITLPAKPLKKANARAQMIRLQISRLLRTLDVPAILPFPSFPLERHDSVEEIAALTRSIWRIPYGPFPNLVDAVEATGTVVMYSDLEHEKLGAMSLPGAGSYGTHIVVINDRLPSSAQRFALAHEVGHLVMHEGVASPEMEKEADDFASALLLPAADVTPKLRNVRFRDLGALKSYWRVSLAALIYRAHALQLISDRHYRVLNMELNKLPNGRKREPGEFPREEPRLARRILERYLDDGYTTREVARLMVMDEPMLRQAYLGEPARRSGLKMLKSV